VNIIIIIVCIKTKKIAAATLRVNQYRTYLCTAWSTITTPKQYLNKHYLAKEKIILWILWSHSWPSNYSICTNKLGLLRMSTWRMTRQLLVSPQILHLRSFKLIIRLINVHSNLDVSWIWTQVKVLRHFSQMT